MNQFDIPPGSIRTSAKSESGGGGDGYEITEGTTVMDIMDKTLYVRTYDNAQTRKVTVSSLDLNTRELSTFALNQPDTAVDLAHNYRFRPHDRKPLPACGMWREAWQFQIAA
jgi:penicillin V acylase-like amidase (Ntn superfamily)